MGWASLGSLMNPAEELDRFMDEDELFMFPFRVVAGRANEFELDLARFRIVPSLFAPFEFK